MDPKNIRGRELARLARLNPKNGHARNIRARLGITLDAPTEPVEVVAPVTRKKAAKKKASKKKTTKKES
jgi:hypothetical protein|tara:strand:- start:50 stop:256 length:207 start_codon:yes stop_codon:yes gene_type:complete